MTARVSRKSGEHMMHRLLIQEWCRTHIGRAIPITNEKDFEMLEQWDDRAVQVIPNTGDRADKKAG